MSILFRIKDHNYIESDKFIAQVSVPVSLFLNQRVTDQAFNLMRQNGDSSNGMLHLIITNESWGGGGGGGGGYGAPPMQQQMAPPPVAGDLVFQIIGAHNLPDWHLFRDAKPYVELHIGANRYKTQAIHHGKENPQWNEEVRIPYNSSMRGQSVLLRIKDHHMFESDKFM